MKSTMCTIIFQSLCRSLFNLVLYAPTPKIMQEWSLILAIHFLLSSWASLLKTVYQYLVRISVTTNSQNALLKSANEVTG